MIPGLILHRRRLWEQDLVVRIHRRKLRDISNVLDMPEQEFVSNFRMGKNCFIILLDEMAPLMKRGVKSTAIPPILKLVAFLRFLAVGSYQKAVGNEHMASMSQAKISETIHECLDIFEQHMCPKWIQFEMSEEEEITMKQLFYNKFGISGVVGCVDGTHIKIKSPGVLRHLYYNRKGYYSINAMIICDFNMVIRFVDARFPGSNHDAFIWRVSAAERILKSAFDAGKRNTWLLGDAGYQLLPYLMTPFRQPHHQAAVNYNSKLTKARNVNERCFGVLKNRFRSIIAERGLHYSPEKATQIVNTCCALHNMCIFYKNSWVLTEEPQYDESTGIEIYDGEAPSTTAVAVREALAQSIYGLLN